MKDFTPLNKDNWPPIGEKIKVIDKEGQVWNAVFDLPYDDTYQYYRVSGKLYKGILTDRFTHWRKWKHENEVNTD